MFIPKAEKKDLRAREKVDIYTNLDRTLDKDTERNEKETPGRGTRQAYLARLALPRGP
jgi:hypothetical protein